MKTIVVIFAALAALSNTGFAECRKQVDGCCAEQIMHEVLRRGDQEAHIKAGVALGTVLAIQLPPRTQLHDGIIHVGNSNLFDHKIEGKDPVQVIISPVAPQGASTASLVGSKSNIQFTIADMPVVLELRITDKASAAVQRLTLHFPELEAEHKRADDYRAQIRTELERELEKQRKTLDIAAAGMVGQKMAQALLVRHTCQDDVERDFDELLILRTTQICAFGDQIYIEFTIRNRRRDTFELGELQVSAVNGGTATDLPGIVEWAKRKGGKLTLKFDEEARGIAVVDAPAKGADAYKIRVTESGGAKREVIVDDIEF